MPLLDALADIGHRPAHLLADKAYSDPLHAARAAQPLRNRSTPFHTVVTRPQTSASQGLERGLMIDVRPERYRERNTVERGFGLVQQCRGIATRYYRYARTYLGGVLAAIIILARQSQGHAQGRVLTWRRRSTDQESGEIGLICVRPWSAPRRHAPIGGSPRRLAAGWRAR